MSSAKRRKKEPYRLGLGDSAVSPRPESTRQIANLVKGDGKRRATCFFSSPLIWAAGLAMMLGASGGVRAWRERAINVDSSRSMARRFPLNELPLVLGSWQGRDAQNEGFDPRIARIAPGEDSLVRTYHNRTTGEDVTVLVVFGRAEALSTLTPATCYPAAGYRHVDGPHDYGIAYGRASALFHESIFTKSLYESIEFVEVFSSFRYDGQWIPDASSKSNRFRRAPAMFTVVLPHRVDESDKRRPSNPSDKLLAMLLVEIVKFRLSF